MDNNVIALERLQDELTAMRIKRHVLLTQKQTVSVLDSELSSLQVQINHLSRLRVHPNFMREQEKIQTALDKTNRVWFG